MIKYNPKTGRMERAEPDPVPSSNVLLEKTKRMFLTRIRKFNFSDEQLLETINKIKSGTRNTRYLVNSTTPEGYSEIVYFLLREIK